MRKQIRWARALARGWMIGALALPGSALAQQDTSALPEVIVSAQKVAENLQTVPVAVSAFAADELEAARIEGVEDLVLRVPTFSFYALNKTQITPALRGASSVIDAAGADQPVAIFLDEVYLGSTGDFEFDLFDLQRIEVLRGPQGTVFGRNVTGGAVSIVTVPPSADAGVVAQASVGRFGQADFKGMVTGPLSDRVFGRLALSSRNSDGWVRNVASGSDLEQEDVLSLRGQLRFAVSEELDIRYSADWMEDESFGQQRDLYGSFPEFTTVTAGTTNNDLDVDGGYDRTIWGQMLRVEWDTAAGAVTSVTGYRRNDSSMSQDGDGTPVPAIVLQRSWDIRTLTQELRLANDGSDRWQWLAGVYYFDQQAERVEDYGIGADPASFIGSLAGGALNNTQNEIFQSIDTLSYAVFAQVTVPLTGRLSGVLGGRYTWEEKSGRSGVSGDPGLFQDDQPFEVPLDDDWSAFTPKAGLNWQASDGAFLYASVSRGFKGGGFAVEGSNADAFATPFDPEFALSYEVGAKMRWLDDRVQLNTAVYHVDYEDLQVQTIDAATGRFFVANVGESYARGVELELVARPAPALDLSLTYGYLDAELEDFVVQGEDLSGNTPPLAPERTLAVAAAYSWELGAAGMLTVRADYLEKSEIYFDASNFEVPGDVSEYPGIVSASLGYTASTGAWEVSVWGKNLTDERVAIQATPNGVFNLEADRFLAGEQSFGVVWNEPRTYGVTATYRFGSR